MMDDYWEGYEEGLKDLLKQLMDEDQYVLETVQRVVLDLLDEAGVNDPEGFNYGQA